MWLFARIAHFYLRWRTAVAPTTAESRSFALNWNRSKGSLARVINIALFASTNSSRYRFLSRFGSAKYGTWSSYVVTAIICWERERGSSSRLFYPLPLCFCVWFLFFFFYDSGSTERSSCSASTALSICFQGMTRRRRQQSFAHHQQLKGSRSFSLLLPTDLDWECSKLLWLSPGLRRTIFASFKFDALLFIVMQFLSLKITFGGFLFPFLIRMGI